MHPGVAPGVAYGLGGWKPRAVAAVRSMTGYTPEHGYVCDEAASPLADQIGSADLAEQGVPSYRVPKLGVLGVEVAAGESALWEAASATTWDHGTDSCGLVLVTTIPDATDFSRSWAGKQVDNSSPGFRVGIGGTGEANALIRDASSNFVFLSPSKVVADGETIVVCAARDVLTDVFATAVVGADGVVYSDSADASAVGDITSAQALQLGRAGLSVGGAIHHLLLLFGGADANGMAADVADIVRRVWRRVRRWGR